MTALIAAAGLMLAGFNYYPGFEQNGAVVEAIIDKGLIAELIIRCDKGTGIIAVSKVEETFCTPSFKCYADLDRAIAETCG